jgi:hypothetical protein
LAPLPVALAVLLVVAGLALLPSPARAQTGQWQVGTASSYSSGRYEADTPTSVVYTPLTARRLFADGDLTLVLPWTCIKGEGGVTGRRLHVRTDRNQCAPVIR